MYFLIFDDQTRKPVTLGQIAPGVPHGFQNIVSLFPTAEEAETALDYSSKDVHQWWFILALGGE